MKSTNTKEKILELLFRCPLKRFHIRETSRILKISPPAISHAVKQLEKENLIKAKKELTYNFQANLDNLSFKNQKRIYNLSSIYSSELFKYLYEKFPLNNIILFGSYSKGNDAEKSDIDIAIESKEKKLELEEYEKKLSRRINLEFIDFKKISKELKENIINGIILSGHITPR